MSNKDLNQIHYLTYSLICCYIQIKKTKKISFRKFQLELRYDQSHNKSET